jgi:two-component system, response regulator, stage 0 sporulation protein F
MLPLFKVLIIDDQIGIRILLKEVFQQAGYETYCAENGHDALALFEKHHPNLVLLDMKIPGMDGLDILEQIRKLDAVVPVFMMTAYGELDLIKQADKLGATCHFTKPFDIEELLQAVKEIFKSRFSSTERL